MNISQEQQAFEHWISHWPFDRNIQKFPNDHSRYNWPEGYCDYEVQLAWTAWQEAVARKEQGR